MIKKRSGSKAIPTDILFGGSDIMKQFVKAAKKKTLGFYEKNKVNEIEKYIELSFTTEDFLASRKSLKKYTHFITNPPFGYHVASDEGVDWARGRVQKSAVFIDKLITKGNQGQKIIAILPHVLLSGSRYKRWRSFIEENSSSIEIFPWGRFSQSADVDVFILKLTIGKESNAYFPKLSTAPCTHKNIGDLFDVKVGPVVPHRNIGKGKWVRYIEVKDSLPWKSIEAKRSIRFKSTTYSPPFIVIRRTSSPTDKKRIVASLIIGNHPVAVENHLIIVKPKSKSLEDCEKLISQLQGSSVDSLVNKQNRCRHLTTQLIKEIPIPW